VLGDRGEMLNKASCQLSTELGTTVSNLPAKRPDWKPVVECEFKQTRMILQPSAPGFDPPENAKKRQGKHYDKDACLTLKQLEKIILLAIIAHNRKPLLDYPLTMKEIGNDVPPIPIDLWNHDIIERAGVLPRFEEAQVRMALLLRDEASVSEEGILFKDCHYSCSEAVSKGWFVTARRKRFKLKAAYDRRLVDTIYVFDPDGSGRTYECRLTTRSDQYKGLAFCEVYAIEKIRRSNKSSLTQTKLQVLANFHKGANPVYEAGKKALKEAKLTASRDARKAGTKEARANELRAERNEVASTTKQSPQAKGNVVAFASASTHAAAGTPTAAAAPAQTPEERLKLMKQRMLRGQL
jgi:putative transposase